MKMFKKILAAFCCVIFITGSVSFNATGADATSHFIETFDSRSGMYTETFANGRQFVTTVPNGGKTYDGVILNIPKDINSVLTCDGKTISFKNGEPLYNKGYYVLSLSTKDVITGAGTSAVYTFRIMGTPSKGAYSSLYNCPKLECINTIESDGETGMYKYTFPNYKGFFTTVPEYNAEVESASFILPVNVGYSLKRNGVQIGIRNNQPVSAPGNYTLTVYGKNYGTAEGYELVYETKLNFTIADKSIPYENPQTDLQTSPVSGTTSNISIVSENNIETTTENDIIQDSLTETYNEGANLYKQTFSNGDGFYTNISNNGISGGNVYIDIPLNMSVSMTKDGLSCDFVNKSYIKEQGTYVLNIISSFGNKKYRARFSFRIQQGIETSNTDIQTVSEEGKMANENEETILPANDVGSEYYDIVNVFNSEKNMFEYTVGEEKFYANMPVGMFSNEGLILDIPESLNCSVTKDGEDYEFSDEMTESGEYKIYVNDLDGNSLTLGFSLYDRAVNSMEGFAAPRGYTITNIAYEDYKNTYSENTEENVNNSQDDISGEEISEEVTDNSQEMEEGEESNISLSETWQAGIDLITVQADKAAGQGTASVAFPIDGKYTIELKGDNLPPLLTEIMIDRTAPDVIIEGLDENMRSTGTNVTVSCDEEDIKMTLFSKNGEEKVLSENGGSVTFNGVGEYTLIAVDEAGNQSEYEFRIVRHIGAAGVGAIVLLLAIIAGIAVFVVYNSKKFSVR